MEINWSDLNAKVSKYFTVHECTFLPSWGIHHTPTDSEKEELVKLAKVMDDVREFLDRPVNVHVWIRPAEVNCPESPHHGQDYNALVGGAPRSAHKLGRGVDFDCGESCDVTRQKLLVVLARFNLCMEKNPGGPWVHLDNYPPRGVGGRYFQP